MKVKVLVIITVAGIFFTLFSQIKADTASSEIHEVAVVPLEETMKQKFLNATVHIVVYPKRNDAQKNDTEGGHQADSVGGIIVERARGIGTVFNFNGHVLIITHDHWSWLSDELNKVEFRDAQNSLLLELRANAFSNLIRYRDGGTLILEPPGILSSSSIEPANLDQRGSLVKGSTVYVAHRPTENRQQVDMLPAIVDSIDDGSGQPTLKIHFPGGQEVIQGDSGGGIWTNNGLVGNLWKAVTVETTLQETSIWGTGKISEMTADVIIAARNPLSDEELEMVLAINTSLGEFTDH